MKNIMNNLYKCIILWDVITKCFHREQKNVIIGLTLIVWTNWPTVRSIFLTYTNCISIPDWIQFHLRFVFYSTRELQHKSIPAILAKKWCFQAPIHNGDNANSKTCINLCIRLKLKNMQYILFFSVCTFHD